MLGLCGSCGRWLGEDRWGDTHLVVLTVGAVATHSGEKVNLAQAGLWGLVRSTQTEYPHRITLLDLEPTHTITLTDLTGLTGVIATARTRNQSQLAIRAGTLHTPTLRRPPHHTLVLPGGADRDRWRLDTTAATMTPEDLALLPTPEADTPLEQGQVRIRVHTAGLNFPGQCHR